MFSRSYWNRELLDAAMEGDVDGMRWALQNGAGVNTNPSEFVHSSTPFGMACYWGRLEVVRLLSSVPGIDLNAVNVNGQSAFPLCL